MVVVQADREGSMYSLLKVSIVKEEAADIMFLVE
jgi:hypothetical protein